MAERFPLVLRLVNSGFHLFSGHSSVVNSSGIQALASSSLPSELSAPTRSLVNSGFQNLGSSSLTPDASVAMERFLGDLETLHDNWTAIQATLMDAEDMEIKQKYVKNRLCKLQKLAFDAENLLDSCEYELLRIEIEEEVREEEREVCIFFTPLLTNVVFRDEVSQMARIMREKIIEIGNLRKALKLDEKDERKIIDEHAKDVVPSGSFQSQEEVFGRDNDVKELVRRLQIDDVDRNDMLNGVHVIAVVGMGGLGKTTLAQKVYNNDTVHFDLKGWAWVSEIYDIVGLTKATLESFTEKKDPDVTQLDPLQHKLHTAVTSKKFLLVLDDIWNDSGSNWETFLAPLRDGAKGSKVLITTRNVSVADAMRVREPYMLDCLSGEFSLMLFQQCASNGSNAIQMEEMGKSIVEKCKGLPLAIKVLGHLLWHSKHNNRWNEVLHDDLRNIDAGGKEILGPLLFSYNHLACNLKQCFKICALFPKDCRINKGELVRLWMAHELIQPCEGRESEDVGMEYINELLSRSFFQHHSYGISKEFFASEVMMHHLIHDLALHISGKGCQTKVMLDEESLKELELPVEARHLWMAGQQGSKDRQVPLTSNYFHKTNDLCTLIAPKVYMDNVEYKGLIKLRALTISEVKPNSIGNLKHLRYLCLSNGGFDLHVSSILLKLMSRFYHLQTLDLRYGEITELPNSIGNLKKLRHLALGTKIEKLPNSIGNLKKLRHLSLHDDAKIKKLPNSIRGLHNLRTLILPSSSIEELPSGITKLTNLRRLNVFPLNMGECASIVDLKNKTHLEGDLTITGISTILSAEDAKEANLMDMRNIHSLTLDWCHVDAVDRQREMDVNHEEVLKSLKPPHCNLKNLFLYHYDGLVLSEWLGDPSSFKKLVKVQLYSCGRCTSLSPLERLPSLDELDVWNMASLKEVVEVESSSCESSSDSGIRSSSPNSQDALFPCLRRLHIYGCPELRSVPTMPMLEYLDVFECESLTSVPLHKYPSLQTASIRRCSNVADFSFTSSTLETLIIEECPLAAFHPRNIVTLPMLSSLRVSACHSLTSVPLHMYPSLRTAEISNCRNLADYPFTSSTLETLIIEECPLAAFHPRNITTLPMLGKLHVIACHSLTSVALHKYPSLRTAQICSCPNLASIEFEEESCSNADYSFTSSTLEYLRIKWCPLATFHPPRMQQLPSTLHRLSIQECPLLEEWCKDHGREYSVVTDFDEDMRTVSVSLCRFPPTTHAALAFYTP